MGTETEVGPIPIVTKSKMSNNEDDDEMDFENLLGDAIILNDDNVVDDTIQFRGFRTRAGYYQMVPRPLNTSLSAYSVGMMAGHERQNVDTGGKSELFSVDITAGTGKTRIKLQLQVVLLLTQLL